MIPYFEAPTLDLGGLTIHIFGVLFLLAVAVGPTVGVVAAWRTKTPVWPIAALMTLVICVSLPLSHVVYVLLYQPERLASDGPIVLLQLTQGLSSTGFVVSLLPMAVLLALVTGRRAWAVLDSMALGLGAAWTVGRLGCFVVHDHPGTETSFFLGVRGICRDGWGDTTRACHDLGLYELIASAAFVILATKLIRSRSVGWAALMLLLGYAPLRFGLDFLRPEASGLLGLSAMQWLCVPMLMLGLIGVGLRLTFPPEEDGHPA
ncbi:MAG: prolipoprotein diacylglyceryl transferase [Proteobacteria bacterium]|nr:prolipoprotein diacylglyceryl transferase [Pseudomonadota bacterium]